MEQKVSLQEAFKGQKDSLRICSVYPLQTNKREDFYHTGVVGGGGSSSVGQNGSFDVSIAWKPAISLCSSYKLLKDCSINLVPCYYKELTPELVDK